MDERKPANIFTFGVGHWPHFEDTITVIARHYIAAWDAAQEELDKRHPNDAHGGWMLELIEATRLDSKTKIELATLVSEGHRLLGELDSHIEKVGAFLQAHVVKE